MTESGDVKKVITYARVSGDDQAKKGFSLPDQRASLARWAGEQGHEIVEHIEDPGWSGASLVRPGLDRVREIVAGGGVDIVVVLFRDRLARGVYAQLVQAELAEFGTRLVALNGMGNDDSPDGQLTGGIMDVISGWERKKIAERTRRGRLQRVRSGKVMSGRYQKYGFRLNEARDAYEVDEERMSIVRRIFHMIGVDGTTSNAVMRLLDAEGVPTPGGGRYWDRSFFRALVLDDAYRPHAYEEVAAVVAPEVAARLDPGKSHGLWVFNRLRSTTKQVAEGSADGGRVYRREVRRTVKPADQWIYVPVPDSGIPREVVDLARNRIKDRKAPSTAARRFWELSGGVVRCGGCGRRLGHHSVLARNRLYHYHYYRCPGHNQHGDEACLMVRNIPAVEVEGGVWEVVSGLLTDPDRLRAGLDEMIQAERKALSGDPDREAKRWAQELADADRKRSGYLDLAAEGIMSRAELKTKLAAIEETRKVAEAELSRINLRKEHIAQLERDKHYLLEDLAGLAPEAMASLTGEERHRVYSLLRLKVTVGIEGDAEVRGAIGEGICITEGTSGVPEEQS